MKNKKNQPLNSRGFTLMELLVTIGIIAILSAISLFAIAGSRKSSRDAKRKADLESIRTALELYRSDCGEYPAGIAVNSPLLSGAVPPCSAGGIRYLEKVPGDPVNSATYAYTRSASRVSYTLCSRLEEIPNPVGDVSGCGPCTGGSCHYKLTNP
ncbi:MAG: General secretion pathway protein G [Candidatus Woesebacteria bacterium GW2011_GWA1_37_8]|uniref:General secretion pathway protein G n=2 Tax=Candidatus Woeseibacteriota TaxID=1752722 RepID=A0A0G0L4V9_9BACT|nr:MAG: General secretion pathway protein G [Microgenomates group bacterium GW2011_GWC1_37_12b]KKQ45502.1 MAG: General secretion pathway protein G [Candidatus Woesebacteria bacterium GW2011_GWA1_37_8]KKQ87028.1 MAG: General secretion pathway protein G [Candidatus Woesebacteria bacterium GW2011_GWB1_38_8b]